MGKNAQELIESINREGLAERFVREPPVLRTRIGVTQDEIGEIIGVSRQTYSAVETGKRKMNWTMYMALLFVFYINPETREEIKAVGLYPEELIMATNINHRL